MPEQLDLLALLPAEAEPLPGWGPCLFNSDARGLQARRRELAAWIDANGRFGCSGRSHAWSVARCCPSTPTDRCNITILDADVRPSLWAKLPPSPCGCDRIHGKLLRRGACTRPGCTWEGRICDSEMVAAYDAADHAWPGWQDLPFVPPCPSQGPALVKWVAKVNEVYPAGWLEAGGPIITRRDKIASRPHGPATPYGGYDIGVIV